MSDIKISRTQKALRLIQDEGVTAKEAAERVGITSSAVSKGKHHPSKTQQKIRMLSEMQEEIESLRQQLAISEAEGLEQARLLGMSGEREAALLAEIEQWNANSRENKLIAEECVRREQDLRQQLAASQAREVQLREVLGDAKPLVQDWCNENGGAGAAVFEAVRVALTLQQDTTALSAMIAKAGEVMRESVIEQCIAMGAMSRDGAFVEEIRALPDVTLEDIRAS